MSVFNIEPQNHCLDAGENKISVPSEIAIPVGGGTPPTSDMRWHKIRTFHCALDCTGKMMISSEAITHILFVDSHLGTVQHSYTPPLLASTLCTWWQIQVFTFNLCQVVSPLCSQLSYGGWLTFSRVLESDINLV